MWRATWVWPTRGGPPGSVTWGQCLLGGPLGMAYSGGWGWPTRGGAPGDGDTWQAHCC